MIKSYLSKSDYRMLLGLDHFLESRYLSWYLFNRDILCFARMNTNGCTDYIVAMGWVDADLRGFYIGAYLNRMRKVFLS